MEFCHSYLFVTFVVMPVHQIVDELSINLIDSHHYKRHKKIRMTEFHSPSLSILIVTQSKASFLVILNYSKMIPRLVESFRNLHLFHSNATKT